MGAGASVTLPACTAKAPPVNSRPPNLVASPHLHPLCDTNLIPSPSRHSLCLQTPQGSIHPLGLAVFWPYHAGLRAKLALQRRFSSEPSWTQITPHYFIGAWPSEEALVPTVHPAVLDVTCELPLQVAPPAYLQLPVWDTHGKRRARSGLTL